MTAIQQATLHAELRRRMSAVWLAENAAVWRNWQAQVRSALPRPARERMVLVARVLCAADILLHRGLLQAIATAPQQPIVVLVTPTEAALALLKRQALAEGWGLSAVLLAEASLANGLGILAGNRPILYFPRPAPLQQPRRVGDETPGRPDSDEFGVLHGSAEGVIAALPCDCWVASPENVAALIGALAEAGLSDQFENWSPSGNALPGAPAVAEAWFRPAEVLMPDADPSDLLVVTRSDGAGDATISAVQPVALGAMGHALTLPILPRHASETAVTMQVSLIGEHQVQVAPPVRMSLPAASLKPDMLTAYLNRGGGGNPVIHAFAAGTGCRLAYAEDQSGELEEVPVVWGVLRGSDAILAQARAQGLHRFYIDHAYFDRGHGHSYRIARNAYEAGPVRKVPDDRLKALDLEIQPWRKGGRAIIVCPPTAFFATAHGCEDWLETTLAQLRMETDRPIVIREKPKTGEAMVPLAAALADAHALVTHSSNVAIEAVCLGTPVFVAPSSAAAPIGLTDLGQIERPRYPKRNGWLAHLAYSQFTLEEIGNGRAWELMMWQETRAFV